MSTPKQKLAQQRNYFKFVLTGMFKPIKLESLTEWEKLTWQQILELKNKLIEEFDTNSKDLGLNIPEHRCFYCHREAKRTYYDDFHKKDVPICNKHLKDFQIDSQTKELYNKFSKL